MQADGEFLEIARRESVLCIPGLRLWPFLPPWPLGCPRRARFQIPRYGTASSSILSAKDVITVTPTVSAA